MSTHNICFHEKIRKISILFLLKKGILSKAMRYKKVSIFAVILVAQDKALYSTYHC